LKYALEIQGLVKKYGKFNALNGLNMTIPAGSIFGLVGANGAGKTTFMSICSGLVKPTTGRIDILERGPFDIDVHSGLVTILPQDSGLPHYTKVEAILQYYGRLAGLSSREALRASHAALDAVNLYDRRKSLIRSLSHGMLRRLTVAQAFLGDPQLIFLDEPMSGLDPREVYNLREFIRSHRGKKTIVVSSHILSELQQFCDHVAFMKTGRLMEQAPLDDILSRGLTLRYQLSPSSPDPNVEKLSQNFQAYRIEFHSSNRQLILTADGAGTAADINKLFIPALLNTGVRLDQVLLGSDLETEYLEASG